MNGSVFSIRWRNTFSRYVGKSFFLQPATDYCFIKPAFHGADTDTDVLTRILADMFDTRDFLKLFLWQAE